MRKILIALGASLSLAGCITEEQLQKERASDLKSAIEMCQGAGYRQGTQQYAGCVTLMTSRMQDQRAASRTERSRKLAEVGQSLQDMDARAQSNFSQTTCTKTGMFVNCTTF